MRARSPALLAAALLLAAGCAPSLPDGGAAPGPPSGDMILATTTSTQNSGLLDAILPGFTDCVVKTVAVGSGQAMRMGERGDTDAVLAHSPDAEERFMADDHGLSRDPVMYNDFVLIGPPDDPAGISPASSAAEAVTRIAAHSAPFVSRGDDSGTHAKELALWRRAGVRPGGDWYVETGQGMGETMTIADQRRAHTLADRGTYLATSGLDSPILFEGTADLRNDYHVIVVNHPATNTGCAQAFAEWIRNEPTQRAIGEFGVDRFGQPLFFPDARRP